MRGMGSSFELLQPFSSEKHAFLQVHPIPPSNDKSHVRPLHALQTADILLAKHQLCLQSAHTKCECPCHRERAHSAPIWNGQPDAPSENVAIESMLLDHQLEKPSDHIHEQEICSPFVANVKETHENSHPSLKQRRRLSLTTQYKRFENIGIEEEKHERMQGNEIVDIDVSRLIDEEEELSNELLGIVICNADRSITHINDAFTSITGYDASDLLGKASLNMLQGHETSSNAVSGIKHAIQAQQLHRVCLVNYRKDGTPFWNFLTIVPMRNTQGFVDAWIGIQKMHQPVSRIDRLLKMFAWNQTFNCASIAAREKSVRKSSTMPCLIRSSSDLSDDGDDVCQDNCNLARPTPVSFISETMLPTVRGTFRLRAYKDLAKIEEAGEKMHLLGAESEIICIISGDIEGCSEVPVRVHDACFTSEVLGSLKCDCREQLEWAEEYIAALADNYRAQVSAASPNAKTLPRGGMIIYMAQEGRGIGLANKIKAYALQTQLGLDTVDANRALGLPDDARSYNCIPSILREMNIKSIRLITNNPRKRDMLLRLGVEVTRTVPVVVQPNSKLTRDYMLAKRSRMEHLINFQ